MKLLYLKHLLSKIFLSLFDNRIIKAILAAWLFFAGIQIYIYGIATVTVHNVLTGVYAAYRILTPIISQILKKGLLEKTFLYIFFMVNSLVMEMVLKNMFGWEHYYGVCLINCVNLIKFKLMHNGKRKI